MSEELKQYLADLNYRAGGLSSQILALRFLFRGTKLMQSPDINEWAGIGDIIGKILEDANAVVNGLDSVNLAPFEEPKHEQK